MAVGSKWPRLLVAGEPVAEERANEIILRTTSWFMLAGNDRQWTRDIAEVLGLQLDRFENVTLESARDLEIRWQCLDLSYLHNAWISSCWIGGPHGWCHWTGVVGCANYNLGKYPSTEAVTADWEKIATAFPYLRLDAQLVEDEGAGPIADQWRIEAGRAHLVEPGERLREQEEPFMRALMIGGERGVTLHRLREAVAQLNAEVKA